MDKCPTYIELLDYFVNHANDIDSNIRDRAFVAYKYAASNNYIASWLHLPTSSESPDLRTCEWLRVLGAAANGAVNEPQGRFEIKNWLVYHEYMAYLEHKSNRGQSGAITESSGKQEDEMTESRPWPNNMIVCRNEAAASLAIASERLQSFIVDEDNADVAVMQALIEVNNALRWLERAGAPTTPPERGA